MQVREAPEGRTGMRIAENVEMLEIGNGQGTIYPVLTWDDEDVILIDTGLPGQLDLFGEALGKVGFTVEQITKVILTHHDMDHIGNAKIIGGFGAKIMAYERETPYIEGTEPSPKLVRMEERLDELTEGERAFYERIKTAAPNFHVHVDNILKDNEMLPYCGGIKIIHTPGHTPGHMALHLCASNILIVGDAANIADNTLTGPNPQHTLDMPTALESYEKLKSINSSAIVCYHGGIVKNENA